MNYELVSEKCEEMLQKLAFVPPPGYQPQQQMQSPMMQQPMQQPMAQAPPPQNPAVMGMPQASVPAQQGGLMPPQPGMGQGAAPPATQQPSAEQAPTGQPAEQAMSKDTLMQKVMDLHEQVNVLTQQNAQLQAVKSELQMNVGQLQAPPQPIQGQGMIPEDATMGGTVQPETGGQQMYTQASASPEAVGHVIEEIVKKANTMVELEKKAYIFNILKRHNFDPALVKEAKEMLVKEAVGPLAIAGLGLAGLGGAAYVGSALQGFKRRQMARLKTTINPDLQYEEAAKEARLQGNAPGWRGEIPKSYMEGAASY